MLKNIITGLFFFLVLGLYAQEGITGYVQGVDSAQWEPKVVLTKIELKDIPDYTKAIFVASSPIHKDGFFSFDETLISDKDNMYRIYISSLLKPLDSNAIQDHLFIASKKDRIHFEKKGTSFSEYATTNVADREWQKLRKFEADFYGNKQREEKESGSFGTMTSYTKDSLRILLVKLIGVRQLENKALLDKDITANTTYYISFLKELKQSDLDRSEYLFLERKLAFLTNDMVEEKYAFSKLINMVLGLILLGLVIFLLFYKRSKKETPIDLSKQEQNIHALILEGKTNKEIASELFISVSTVKSHITNMYGKLQVSNRKELLRKTLN